MPDDALNPVLSGSGPPLVASVPAGEGYDAALTDEAEDLIGRRHVGRRVHRLLTKTPAEWSVRVGLLGDWGAGKSTVAKWAKALSERDGHLVVWFSPAAAATKEELWAGLASAIRKAAEPRGLLVKAGKEVSDARSGFGSKAERTQWFDAWRIRLRGAAVRAQPIAKATKASEAAVSALADLLKIGREDLTRLRQTLGEHRRVVVVLDDLDRVDPRLLPGLLLALLDVLDLPGFSFLLPFDERVVAASLREYNKAWGDGRRFLDKILDFRVHLPPIGPADRRRLFEAEAARACHFVPHGAAAGLEGVLPPNPRRLKALARGLSLMEEEAHRHRHNEIDWRSAIYASLLREEDEAFFRAYVENTFNALSPDGMTRRSRQFERLVGKQKGAEEERERVQALLRQHAPGREDKHDHLWKVCDAWLRDVGAGDPGRVYHTVRLLTETSEGATWADRDRVLDLFRAGASAEDVAGWAGERAAERGVDAQGLSTTLVLTLCAGYGGELGVAADALLASEHARVLAEAGTSLDLLDTLSGGGLPGLAAEDLRAVAFPALLSAVSRWERSAGNAADDKARERELALLSKWADAADARQRTYIEAVEGAEGVLQRVMEGESHLRTALRARLVPAGTEALARLERQGGVEELLHMNGSDLDRTALLDPDGTLWRTPQVRGAAAVLAEAPDRPEVQGNAKRLLDLLRHALRGDITLRAASVPEKFLKSRALGVVWAAATVTPLQPRRLEDLRSLRGTLIESGADGALLPVPAWLEAE